MTLPTQAPSALEHHSRQGQYAQVSKSGARQSLSLAKKDLRSRYVVPFRDMRILDCDPLLPLSHSNAILCRNNVILCNLDGCRVVFNSEEALIPLPAGTSDHATVAEHFAETLVSRLQAISGLEAAGGPLPTPGASAPNLAEPSPSSPAGSSVVPSPGAHGLLAVPAMWIRVDVQGAVSRFEATRLRVSQRFGIALRDLRLVAAPSANQASVAIFARPRYLVLHLRAARMLILEDSVLMLLDPHSEDAARKIGPWLRESFDLIVRHVTEAEDGAAVASRAASCASSAGGRRGGSAAAHDAPPLSSRAGPPPAAGTSSIGDLTRVMRAEQLSALPFVLRAFECGLTVALDSMEAVASDLVHHSAGLAAQLQRGGLHSGDVATHDALHREKAGLSQLLTTVRRAETSVAEFADDVPSLRRLVQQLGGGGGAGQEGGGGGGDASYAGGGGGRREGAVQSRHASLFPSGGASAGLPPAESRAASRKPSFAAAAAATTLPGEQPSSAAAADEQLPPPWAVARRNNFSMLPTSVRLSFATLGPWDAPGGGGGRQDAGEMKAAAFLESIEARLAHTAAQLEAALQGISNSERTAYLEMTTHQNMLWEMMTTLTFFSTLVMIHTAVTGAFADMLTNPLVFSNYATQETWADDWARFYEINIIYSGLAVLAVLAFLWLMRRSGLFRYVWLLRRRRGADEARDGAAASRSSFGGEIPGGDSGAPKRSSSARAGGVAAALAGAGASSASRRRTGEQQRAA